MIQAVTLVVDLLVTFIKKEELFLIQDVFILLKTLVYVIIIMILSMVLFNTGV